MGVGEGDRKRSVVTGSDKLAGEHVRIRLELLYFSVTVSDPETKGVIHCLVSHSECCLQ